MNEGIGLRLLQIAQSTQDIMRDTPEVKRKTLLTKSNPDNRWHVTRHSLGIPKTLCKGKGLII